MAYSRRATIFDVTTRRPGKPSAGDARNDALRAIVRAIVATDHGGVQRPAAASLGVTASALNDFLNGRKGAGQALMDGIVAYLRRPSKRSSRQTVILSVSASLGAADLPSRSSSASSRCGRIS